MTRVKPKRTARATLFRVALVAFFAVVTCASRARAADPFDATSDGWDGCIQLITLAHASVKNVVVTRTLKYDELKPEDGVLILHPKRTLDSDSLSRFMRAGGRVAIFDDFGAAGTLLPHFRMKRIPLPGDVADAYRRNPALAIAEPASLHPVVADVDKVILNHATALSHENLTTILKVRSPSQGDVAVAVAGAVEKGRLLVASDASIVINTMLRFPGNRQFAQGVARYLVDDDVWGARQGRLFIVTYDFAESGTFGDASALSEATRTLSETFRKMQADGMPSWLLRGLGILLALGLVAWAGIRAGRTHKPSTPRFVRGVPIVAQGGVAGRVAVLAAPTTPRLLVATEVKRAFEEFIVDRMTKLGLVDEPSAEAAVSVIRAQGLVDESTYAGLRTLMYDLARVETRFMSREKKMSEDELGDLVERARKVTAKLAERFTSLERDT